MICRPPARAGQHAPAGPPAPICPRASAQGLAKAHRHVGDILPAQECTRAKTCKLATAIPPATAGTPASICPRVTAVSVRLAPGTRPAKGVRLAGSHPPATVTRRVLNGQRHRGIRRARGRSLASRLIRRAWASQPASTSRASSSRVSASRRIRASQPAPM